MVPGMVGVSRVPAIWHRFFLSTSRRSDRDHDPSIGTSQRPEPTAASAVRRPWARERNQQPRDQGDVHQCHRCRQPQDLLGKSAGLRPDPGYAIPSERAWTLAARSPAVRPPAQCTSGPRPSLGWRSVRSLKTPEGFHVDSWMEGTDSRGLNRELLSALRRIERRTRLRAEWTSNGVTDRFFDYVQKGTRPVSPAPFVGVLAAEGSAPFAPGILGARSDAGRSASFVAAPVSLERKAPIS